MTEPKKSLSAVRPSAPRPEVSRMVEDIVGCKESASPRTSAMSTQPAVGIEAPRSEPDGTHASLMPSPWVSRFAHLVPPRARVLDLACGRGRHARLFADRGCRVLAVDRDAEALATLTGVAGVEARNLDLETGSWPLPGERFDAIVVANYLHRPLFPFLLAALSDDGALLYETFARGNEAYGRPANPDFLLEPQELLVVANDRLRVVAFEQGWVASGGGGSVVQRLAGVGLARPWPPALEAV